MSSFSNFLNEESALKSTIEAQPPKSRLLRFISFESEEMFLTELQPLRFKYFRLSKNDNGLRSVMPLQEPKSKFVKFKRLERGVMLTIDVQ